MTVSTLLGRVELNMVGGVMYGDSLQVCDSDGKLISEISHSDLEAIVGSETHYEFGLSGNGHWKQEQKDYIESLYNKYVRLLEYSTEGMITFEDKIQELMDLLKLDYLFITHGEINARKMMKKMGLARKDPNFESLTWDPLYRCDRVRRIGDYYFFLEK